MKHEKSLTELRMEVVECVIKNPNIPNEYKDFTKEVVIDVFNIIGKHMAAVELAFRRTRDHPDIKTPNELRKSKGGSKNDR